MAQNFTNYTHGSPPNRPSQGFEDLMGSLKSPGLAGPAAALQQGLATSQWPMQWPQDATQANFPFNLPHQMSPPNPMAWTQNNQDGYVQFEQEGDDETFTHNEPSLLGYNGPQNSNAHGGIPGGMVQGSTNHQGFPPGTLPNLSSSSPLSLPPSQLSEGRTGGAAPVSKSPMVSTAATTARAAELRAKLLASRGPKSRQGSPAVKTTELGGGKQSQLPDTLKKQTNGGSGSEPNHKAVLARKHIADTSAPQASDGSTATATSLDNLMAEARDAADAHNAGAPLTNGQHEEGASGGIEAAISPNGIQNSDNSIHNQQLNTNKSRSVSELSEPGEIRSGASTPAPIDQPPASQATEPGNVVQDNQDKQEKLARQNEVKKAYQPLKKSKPQKQESKSFQAKPSPTTEPAKVPQQSRKPSFERRQSAFDLPPTLSESRREQHRERAMEYDRQEEDRNLRRPSGSQTYQASYDLERDLAARKQRTDDNARKAAEYKRGLEAQRAQARQAISNGDRSSQQTERHEASAKRPLEDPSTNVSRKASMVSNGLDKTEPQDSGVMNGQQDVDTVMTSPTAPNIGGNDDINDWLELTEFYDEEYRERRLKLFRKKKALDIQRAELEREEELELQERVQRTRSQSILPTSSPSSTIRRPTVNVRMPPPPLPLPFRDGNKDTGMKIKDAALSAGLTASQTFSPKLKRQYAEDSTEISPTNVTDKRVRLDTFGLSSDDRPLTSPSTIKGNRPFAKGEPPMLESRVTRYDSWTPRPRDRSPEYRRRSLSPGGRRDYSPPPPNYRPRDYSTGPRRFEDKTCFNCGERGHMLSHCPAPRKDGKPESTTSRGYERWVSPNYRGKNPVAKGPPPPANGKARMNSIGKTEQGNSTAA